MGLSNEIKIYSKKSLHPDFRMPLCFASTKLYIRFFKFNDLMHRLLGQAALLRSLGVRLGQLQPIRTSALPFMSLKLIVDNIGLNVYTYA